MLSILAGILLLGVCVFFHELGHFLIGKLSGVRPRVFSIGYGRGWLFKRRKGTIYQITAIPLGGYVQFYGDDPSKQDRKVRKGDFFSVGPWRRIALAFGGPFFSVLLGFFIVLFLLLGGYRPMDNTVRVDEKSSVYAAGLRDGDRIERLDGNPTPSFDRIMYEAGFAKSETIDAHVLRDGKNLALTLPITRSEPGTPGMLIGARPLSRLTMVEPGPKGTDLKKGDEILKANGVTLYSIEDLIQVLNAKEATSAELLVQRDGKVLTLVAPLKKVPRVTFKAVRDVQTGKKLPEIIVEENGGADFQNIFINGESFTSFANFRKTLEAAARSKAELRVGPVVIAADIDLGFRNQIGIRPAERALSNLQEVSFFGKVALSFDETIFIAKSTFVGLWRIIEGKLSFNKSVSGPVKMVAIAAKTVEMGWQTYFLLMAQITIILGVMNLLPIPVLDGGHILFYLIEALYKPLSFKVQAAATRVGMVLMLAMGVYVIGLDIVDVFFRKILG